ncbi:M20 family metallopeptidase [Taklimakanibacter lacteus]|uniref:M20 family metallopeptidase n=1 Tax=Taklimakanibacter lacteus TaxID=2268456 RepID=UPI000E66E1B5
MPFADDAQETIALTRALIAENTIDPPGNEIAAARIVAGRLAAAGIEPVLDEIAPGRVNLSARLPGTGERPGLAMSAHFDTIGVERARWSRDPFAGEIDGPFLYGRGSADMKGGLAAMALAMIDLAKAKARPKGDLMLAFSAAENSSCLGAKRLVSDRRFDGIGALLVSEPTGLAVLVAEKGPLWFRATAQGDYQHGAFTEGRKDDRGNAIVRLARFIDRLHDLDLDAPAHRHLKPPTITVGLIRGGVGAPFIAPEASCDVDVRLVPGLSAEMVMRKVAAMAGPHISLEVLDVKPPVDTPDDHPFVAESLAACADVLGRADGPSGVAYYSDAAIICPALDLPMVIIGPGEIGMSGRIDEHVSVGKLVTSRAIYRRVAQRMLAC